MKKILMMTALVLPLAAPLAQGQQSFDFSSLDRLGANAKNKTDVTLDANMLKLAAGFLQNDKDSAQVKSLVENLKAVYVRDFEFDREGEYADADLAPFRTYLKQTQWTRIVESVEGKDVSEVWLQPMPNNQTGGVAVISAGPKNLTVVYINGVINLNDISKLGGNMGIPEIKLDHNGKAPARQPGKARKENEE
jgi:hypothetical protein